MLDVDFRQFRIRHVLLMTLSFSVALIIYQQLPTFGFTILVLVSLIWVGFACLFIADSFQTGRIDDRHIVNQLLNGLGVLLIAIGSIYLFLWVSAYLSFWILHLIPFFRV